MKNANKGRLGFTLIELLVVVLIIGILAAVALPQYNKAVEKSRMTEAWTTLKAIDDALKVYRMENDGAEATTFADLGVAFTDKNGAVATGSSFETKNFTYYLSKGNGWSVCPGTDYYPALAGRTTEDYTLQYCGGTRYCTHNATNCAKYGFKTSKGSGCLSGDTCYVE